MIGADAASGSSPVLGLVRAAATHQDAARTLRGFVTREVLGPIASRLDVDDAKLRAALVSSQMVGLAMARHVIGFDALAEAGDEELVAWYGPTIQRYLTAPDP